MSGEGLSALLRLMARKVVWYRRKVHLAAQDAARHRTAALAVRHVHKVWGVTTPDGELFLFTDETDAHRYGWRHRVDPVELAVFGQADTDALIRLAPERKAGES